MVTPILGDMFHRLIQISQLQFPDIRKIKDGRNFCKKKLGSHYVVIEEGLNGRTTNLDYSIPPVACRGVVG